MGTFQDIAPRLSRSDVSTHKPLRPKIPAKHSTSSAPRKILAPTAAKSQPATTATRPRSSTKSYAATIALALALGLLAQFQVLGMLIILAYATASVIWRIPSRKTFLLALLSIGATAVALLINRWVAAKNFAAYSFLLMAAGTLSSCIEQGRLSSLLHKKHQMLQTNPQDANVKKPY